MSSLRHRLASFFGRQAPAVPPRFEIRDHRYGVVLLDHARGRKYAFKAREHAETAIRMISERGFAPLLGASFSPDDYR